VVDDNLAIAVIALFYSKAITVGWLLGALGGLTVVVALRRLGVTSIITYAAVGLAVWFATY
jgi:Na+:H+ antiporter, NhaA family